MFAARAAARSALRAQQPKTRAISNLVNKPSTVDESQKLFTSSHQPTYYKRDGDKVWFMALFGAWGFGMVQFLRGEVNMGMGWSKKE